MKVVNKIGRNLADGARIRKCLENGYIFDVLEFDEEMVALAARIHPLVRLRMTPRYDGGRDILPNDFFRVPFYNDDEPFNSSEGKVLAYMRHNQLVDVGSMSFLNVYVEWFIKAGELEKICDIEADHSRVPMPSSGDATKFYPTMSEVLCAIPDELLETVDAFEIHADGLCYEEREDGGCTSTVTLYKAPGGVPEAVQQPDTILLLDHKLDLGYDTETSKAFVESCRGPTLMWKEVRSGNQGRS